MHARVCMRVYLCACARFRAQAEQEGVAAPADEVLRKALEEVLSAYAKNTYAPDKGASVSTASLATGGGAHTLLISSVNTNLGAYWSGSWRSRYTVQGSQGSVKVSGRVQIKVRGACSGRGWSTGGRNSRHYEGLGLG